MNMIARIYCFLVLLACTAIAVAGCNEPSNRQAISGSVLLDGQPLAHGSIRFEPRDAARAQASGAVIAAGKFAVARDQGLVPGTYRVAVSSPKNDPAAAPSMDGGGLAEERIPRRYNIDSELEIVVEPRGGNQFTFDLITNGGS
jgi:hypothetical protein